MGRFVSRHEHKQIRDLVTAWERVHRLLYAKYLHVVAALLMAGLVPFDFLLFPKNATLYANARLGLLLSLIASMIAVRFASLANVTAKEMPLVNSFLLLYPTLAINGLYHWFLFVRPPDDQFIVMIGNLMVAFFTTFFVGRFWREQYILNWLSIGSASVIAFANPNRVDDFVLIIIAHLCSGFTAVFFRREYMGAMYERYTELCSLVPKRVAAHLSVSHRKIQDSDVFRARQRFTVCLCSDWRNYQQLARENSPEYIERLFSAYYNLVFDHLEAAAPSGSYFADWVADELFVVFFDENDDEGAVLESACRFIEKLTNEIPPLVDREFSGRVRFDVGVASGHGLLGLQGPNKRKKTTITAESAGIAKRLESEAKNCRKLANYRGAVPFVVVDGRMHNAMTCRPCAQVFEGLRGSAKDVAGSNFFVRKPELAGPNLTNDSSDVEDLPLSA